MNKEEYPWGLRKRKSLVFKEKAYISAAIRGGGMLTVRSAIEGKAIYSATLTWKGKYRGVIKSDIKTTIEAALESLEDLCTADAARELH